MKKQRLATLAPHLGDEAEDYEVGQPLVAPLYQTSVFSFPQLHEADDVQSGARSGYIYSRMGNPTIARLERALAQLEEGESGLVTASGMGAIAATLLALAKPGDRVVAGNELYGGTSGLLTLLERFGLRVELINVTNASAVAEALSESARLVLVETLTNPCVGVADLPTIAPLSRRAGAHLVVDNTFATPYLCQPLQQGADIVIHSLTKFIGGHADITGGVCVGPRPLIDTIRPVATLLGATPDPFAAWLTLRGAKTLALRMEKSCATASLLAHRLLQHPAVKAVYYPGLTQHPTHAVAKRVLNGGYGAMFSFELQGGEAAVERLVRTARLLRFVPSLGDVATTLSYPSTTSHRTLSHQKQKELGITPGLVRISTGIEDAEDLWQDFLHALGTED